MENPLDAREKHLAGLSCLKVNAAMPLEQRSHAPFPTLFIHSAPRGIIIFFGRWEDL